MESYCYVVLNEYSNSSLPEYWHKIIQELLLLLFSLQVCMGEPGITWNLRTVPLQGLEGLLKALQES